MSLRRQIEAFRAIIQTGTMTEASTVLRTSQPAVSRLISDLEARLGLKLFERRHGRVSPTYEAMQLNDTVEKSYVGLDLIVQAAADLREFRDAQISIAAMPALSLDVVPEALSRFLAEYPSVRVDVHARSSRQVVQAVASGQADIGMASKPYDVAGIRCDLTVAADYVCLVPSGHALTEQTVLTPALLSEEPIIALTNFDTYTHLDTLFQEEGRVFRPRIETPLSVVAARHVEFGLGIALVDPFTVRYCAGRPLEIRPFAPSVPFSFGILSSPIRAENSAVSRFREILIETIQDIAPEISGLKVEG